MTRRRSAIRRRPARRASGWRSCCTRLAATPTPSGEVETAALDSERGRDDEQAGRAWSTLGFLVGTETSHAEEGLRAKEAGASGVLDRSRWQGEHVEEWDAAPDGAAVAHGRSRQRGGGGGGERSVALDHQHPEWALPLLADLANLATIYAELGRSGGAISIEKQIVVEMEKSIGPDHPRLEPAPAQPGARFTTSVTTPSAAAARSRPSAHGQARSLEYPMLALDAHQSRAFCGAGPFAEAIADARRALAVYGKQLLPNDPSLWDLLVVVGAAELGLGHAASAVPTLTCALALVGANRRRAADRPAEPRFCRALHQTSCAERARKLAADAEAGFWPRPSRAAPGFVRRLGEVRDRQVAHRSVIGSGIAARLLPPVDKTRSQPLVLGRAGRQRSFDQPRSSSTISGLPPQRRTRAARRA